MCSPCSSLDNHNFDGTGWSQIRATVEAEINKQKVERITRERKSVIDSRKQAVKALYSAYKKTLVPTQWAYHPRNDQVCNFEDIAALINDPLANIELSHYHEALNKLPGLIEAFNEEKKALLLSLLSPKDSSSSINNDVAGKPGRTCLDLATSIFQCSTAGCQLQGRPLIAWQRVICHSCSVHCGQGDGYAYGYRYLRGDTLTPAFTFSDCGSIAVESLAALLIIDAREAVPADYDRKTARFVCLNCNLSSRAGINGREALTWRECVSTFMSSDSQVN